MLDPRIALTVLPVPHDYVVSGPLGSASVPELGSNMTPSSPLFSPEGEISLDSAAYFAII